MAKSIPHASTSRSGGKVTVACKLPHGLILQLCEPVEVRLPSLGGGIVVEKQFRKTGESVTINGNRVPFGQAPKHEVAGGYALTPGVDQDFFEQWLDQNKELDLVKNGLIFAHASRDHAVGQAQEQKANKSGLEPFNGSDPMKDPRMPKSRFAVEPASRVED